MESEPKRKNSESEPKSGNFVTVKVPGGFNFATLLWNIVILFSVAAIIVSLVALFTGRNILETISPPTTASVTTTETIVSRIQPLRQLVTISVQLAKADINVGVRQGPLNACGFAASYVAQGTIEAGIDFASITEANISFDDASNTYTVALPPPQLTSCRIDFIDQYTNTTVACTADFDAARQIANYQALAEFRDDALAEGILNRAGEDARSVLSNFIAALTLSNVRVNFAEAQTDQLPDSCAPEPPVGWVYDPISNAWNRQ